MDAHVSVPAVAMARDAERGGASSSAHTTFEADVYMFSSAEGGPERPTFSGYAPTLDFGVVSGGSRFDLPANVEFQTRRQHDGHRFVERARCSSERDAVCNPGRPGGARQGSDRSNRAVTHGRDDVHGSLDPHRHRAIRRSCASRMLRTNRDGRDDRGPRNSVSHGPG